MIRVLSIILLGVVVACSPTIERGDAEYKPQTPEDRRENDMKSLVTKSDDPIVIYGGKKSSDPGGGTGFSGGYLWRAALDSISFMPLISVDANSGVILTDWYASPQTPNEKFKFNILVLSSELQINSIKVSAFRKVQTVSGQWKSAEVSKELVRTVEDNILKRAIALKAKASN
ncbi:MAG: DUF3576 domain-containing protein [Rickettsiales bacterium]|jgi:hypothetical protein|nr:DUF3576 domain-containing protein [Rickettsiales bacterium]